MALAPGKSGDPVLSLDGLVARLRVLVTRQAGRIIAVSIPMVILSMTLMVLLRRAGVDTRAGIDYQVYRWAVQTWLSGGDIMNTAPTTSIGRVLPWVYPPFALLPLLPFALLPFVVGLFLLYGVNLLVLGVVMYLVVRHMWPAVGERGARAVAFALLPWTLFLEPVYATFGLGQINILLMGLVAVDCLVRTPRWPRGALVGIAAAIKLAPAIFLLFFLVRRDFRAAATAALAAAVGTALGFLMNPVASLDYWFHTGPAGGVSGSSFHTNQSIEGALARMELPPLVESLLWLALSAALLWLVVDLLRRLDAPLAMAVTGLLGLLLSPTSWSNHWVWVVPGLLILLGTAVARGSRGWLLATAVTGIIAVFGSFRLAPAADPTAWSPWHHVVGNAYLLLGIFLLGALWRYAARSGDHADPERGPGPVGSSVSTTR